ncbi:MAG: diguanylate cyclase [Candidatus Omnitrophica bacterium]|nr:diguanylate cyclase [Candidatus Omnitrophota bacterium]
MSDLLPFVFVINSMATILAGSYLYILKGKKLQNSIWLVYNILFCIWNFCLYKALISTEEPITLYWFRAALASLIFMVPVFLHFLSIYSDREVFKKKLIAQIYVIFFLIFSASFAMSTEFIKEVRNGVYFKNIIVPTIPFHIFTIIFAGFVFCGFYYILFSNKEYLSFKRNQRLWLFLGMFFGMLAPVNFILSVYKIEIYPVSTFFVIPYLILVGYIVAKYHVYEINVAINKMVVLSYATLFIIVLHMGVVYVLHRKIGMEYFESSILSGCGILLCLLFAIHFKGNEFRLNRLAEHIVYDKRFNYYKFLENFNYMLNKEKDPDILLNYIVESVYDVIGVECVSLYLYDEEDEKFKLKAQKGLKREKLSEVSSIPPENAFINLLNEGNVFVLNEEKDFANDYSMDEVKKIFNKINTRLTIPLYYSMPLYYSNDIVGFLNLGEKKDNADYNKEDIDILNAFGRELGVCLDTAKLFSEAIKDDLTKLYRYSYFHMRIDEELARSKRYNRPLSLIMVDVDNFKNINDGFGHQAGDEALRVIARMMKRNLRKVDISARYGGEEFGILLPETEKNNAHTVAERIRKSIEEEFRKPEIIKKVIRRNLGGKEKLELTISIGISTYRPEISKEDLVREADEALYKAKKEGKNRICIAGINST